MKAVAFNGSPRQGGNTGLLLRAVLKPIAQAGIETELIHIGGQPIRGCLACYQCLKKKDSRCSNNQDPVNQWIAKMLTADAIILGSPTYFAGMTPEMKALCDRAGFVARVNGFLFARKVGAAVVAQRRGGAVNVLDSIHHMFLISKMIIPGSTYWNFGVGLDPGEVQNDTEANENMHDLGTTIAWLVTQMQQVSVLRTI
jgi:multimeric flavodoxin WrbA